MDRLVHSRSTCPPPSPPPLANTFVIGIAVINTHPVRPPNRDLQAAGKLLICLVIEGTAHYGEERSADAAFWRGPYRGWRTTATGVGSLSHPYHITRSYCSLTRPLHTHPLVLVKAISRMQTGPMVCATCWSSKLSTPRSHQHLFCIVALLGSRSFTQAGPWIIATQLARNALPRDLVSDCILRYVPS